MNKTLLTVLAVAATASTLAQDLTHSAPPQERPIAITGATIHPVSSEPIENGWILFDQGEIVEMGQGERMFVAITRVIDGRGKHVYPGLIAPDTELGLFEHGAVRATRDANEIGHFTPEARAAVAVNPDSALIPVARSNGILTFAAFPSSGMVPGRASLMRADGWTWEDMAIRTDAGLILNWPSMRPNQNWWNDEPEAKQAKAIKNRLNEIDELFRSAVAYRAARAADPNAPTDLRLEALQSVLPGESGEEPERPTLIRANDIDQINAAVTWATGMGLRVVLLGGRDAPLAAELLKKHDIPVVIAGTHRFPKRADSPYDEAYTLPQRLAEAGVRWCLASADREGNIRNLPYEAAMSVAFGLSEADAIRGMTLSTAEIFEIDDLIGSLEPGKLATMIVTDASPLQIRSNVEMAFIDGREVDLSNKQTKLAEKYREKYRQIGLERDNED